MKRSQYKYFSIYQDIKGKILDGTYKNGDKLPIEFDLIKQYGTSRDTVRRAMKILEAEELIIRLSAKGTFVKFNRAEHTITRLRSFSEIMSDEHTPTISKGLEVCLIEEAMPEVQLALELSPLHRIYRITRTRYAGELPLSLETAYVPYYLCPNLNKYVTPNSSLFRLYEAIYQHRLGESSISIRAELPTKDVADILNISSATPILKTISIGHLADGTPLYYAISQYEGSKYIYRTTMKRYY